MNISARLIIEPPPKAKPDSFEWNSLAPAVVAGLIVVVGWLVVERFARRREKRSDLRSAVEAFALAVDEVADTAVVFYQLPGNDPHAQSLAEGIRIKIGSLSTQLLLLKEAGLPVKTDELLKRFRQSVTGGSFDEAARQPLLKDSPIFARFAADAQSLSREVQQEMLRHLLNRRRFSWRARFQGR